MVIEQLNGDALTQRHGKTMFCNLVVVSIECMLARLLSFNTEFLHHFPTLSSDLIFTSNTFRASPSTFLPVQLICLSNSFGGKSVISCDGRACVHLH